MATKTKKRRVYDPVPKRPVARFFYQGTHSHPIRRTVLITETTPTLIKGYEFREGFTVRTREQALGKMKSYRRDRIAKWGDYSRLTMYSPGSSKNPDTSTLERFPLLVMFTEGA